MRVFFHPHLSPPPPTITGDGQLEERREIRTNRRGRKEEGKKERKKEEGPEDGFVSSTVFSPGLACHLVDVKQKEEKETRLPFTQKKIKDRLSLRVTAKW